ncbi:STAS domain-containing protein [Helcococcus ovis]|uniref:Anti-sigma factor antagonist n=1 Tax=Helcococcus ovis TaxID=72026 RepID=A0A4R9C384_9FIRM|nr:STAS domain-containing protein [Helcococcus ovis]TFF65325.1 anti-sigma factor antagonist [Helcococcus ovis]TFF66504.1 anti-sigma factor antagonist [Helcococcus ovis]TFF67718.1 anti-sigma factor antagonist [Helcococcus ovis]WNZ01273.1 STAS domain-containing protein [Helcococcus ovis]
MAFEAKYKENENFEIHLSGDLDINVVENFKNEILDKYKILDKNIVFDFSDLKYIDSTGIGVIMTVYKEAKDKLKTLTIKNANRNIYKLFKITKLTELFNMED